MVTYPPLLLLSVEIFHECSQFQLFTVVKRIEFQDGIQIMQHLIIGLMFQIDVQPQQWFLAEFFFRWARTIGVGVDFYLTLELLMLRK